MRKETKTIYKKYFTLKNKYLSQHEKIKSLNKEVRKLNSKKNQIENCKKLLKQRGYTHAEVKFLVTGKQPRKLQFDDVKKGLVLRSMSVKAYRYLYKKKTMYLPGPRTIAKYKKAYFIRYGFQDKLLR